MEVTMKRTFVWILGAVLLTAILAAPASAQVSVHVGVGVPPVAAGVVIGAPPVYAYPYPAYPQPPGYYYPYPGPYYYGYPVYGRVYYAPRYYYGPGYYRGGAPYYYRGGAPYYRGGAAYNRGPVYRGNVQVSPGNAGNNVRYSRGNGRR
jgi:hypothetical protein